MNETSLRRVKPSLDTPFHIDYEWWGRDTHELRVYLISFLPPEKQIHFTTEEALGEVDWVDPDTAEVKRVDGLQVALQEAIQYEDLAAGNLSLVDAVFRVFIANNNEPQSPNELGEIIGKRPDMILRTLSGVQVYKGIRPVSE